ncbi:MAG: glycine zipper family protein [Rhodospirillales bacterium]|nr:glycine zipper family protein [Rhodospirillales bacterium]
MALPGKGKDFDTFRQDDAVCRGYAEQQIGYGEPAQAATAAGVGSAAIGTALGAVAGAAIGSVSGQMGAGAAIGGATGLIGGSMVGAGNAQASAGGMQRRYDIAYTQCMYAKGNRVESRPRGYGYGGYGYGGYGYPAYGYPAYPGYPPMYYGPGWGW